MSAEDRSALNAEFRRYLQEAPEVRAMGESGTGGDLVAPGFSGEVIRLLKSYAEILGAVEDLETPNGNPWGRPQVSSLVASSAATTEGTQVTSYGGEATGTMAQVTFAGVQQFGLTPTYICRLASSLALVEDSAVDLIGLLGSAAAQALGREVSSVLSTAVYASATSGQEATLTTLTATSLAKLIPLVDPAYHKVGDGSAFYMSPVDAGLVFGSTGILANGPRELYGFPVVLTNACTNYVSTTVTGPIFGNMGQAFTMRRAGGVETQVLRERYIDWAQIGVNCYLRCDFAARGQATALAFSK